MKLVYLTFARGLLYVREKRDVEEFLFRGRFWEHHLAIIRVASLKRQNDYE
jgi:hypothetical protein